MPLITYYKLTLESDQCDQDHSPVLPVPDIVVATDDASLVESVYHDANNEEHHEIGEAAARGRSPVVIGTVTTEPRAAAAATVVIVARLLVSTISET